MKLILFFCKSIVDRVNYIYIFFFLPDELVLKKRIVALVMELNILLCKFIEARMQTDTKVAVLRAVNNIRDNVRPEKTKMQVCRETVHHRNVFSDSSRPVFALRK